MEDKSSRKQELLMQMLRNIPNAMIWLIDRDLQVIMAEGAELRKTFRDRNLSEKGHIREFFETKVYHALNPLLRVSMKGTSVSHELMINDHYYFIQAVPIRENNSEDVVACMLIFENITEDKLSAEALKSAMKRAERSNEAKSKFLASVSHEIRTPLNTVIGFTEQLLKTKLDEKQSTFLNAIRDSSSHLLSIVNETITLSQVEIGEINFESKVFNLGDVFSEIENIERLKAEKKGIELFMIKSHRLDYPISGDVVRLKQILLNLVNNAIKFTEKGSVTLSAEIENEYADEVGIIFRVIDTGIGIEESKRKLIFKEFTQADGGITKKFGGSGLGLTIAKKLVQMQNGKIAIESTPGEGSEFIVTLPFKKVPFEKLPAKQQVHIDPIVLKNKFILLVDDDELNRLLAKTIFDEWDVRYKIAVDGFQAIEMCQEHDFDIILMDIHMPGMSGMEATQRIRKMKKQRKEPLYILAVTANVIERDLRRFLNADMDGYLLKPFNESELFDTLVRFFFDENIEDMQTLSKTEEEKVTEQVFVDQDRPYNLAELESTTRGNKTFFNTMVNTFISNTHSNIKLMRHFLQKEDWKSIGELAHKMIPSGRHIQAMHLVELLEHTEDLTLRKKNYGTIPEMIHKIVDSSDHIIRELKKELKQ